VIGIHSNSKWARGLGRRLGWIEAAPGVIDAIERVQQCSILCPDTLEQMTMARYLKRAIPSGSLQRYVDHANALYKRAAQVTSTRSTGTSGARAWCPRAGSTRWWTSAATPRPSCPRR
jgi:DNA-binding transcriptional MocR family regulator